MAKEKIDIPIYSLTIQQLKEDYGVSMMSLVDSPAVGKAFLALAKSERAELKLSLNDEKRIVTGVALRANYPIYRKDPKTGAEFYFTITAGEMLNIVVKFMRDQNGHKVNIDHDEKQVVEEVFLFESFILPPNHEQAYPDFADVEPGSWMVSYKVENDQVWNAVKKGLINGFSVEIGGDLHSTIGEARRTMETLDMLHLLKIIENHEAIN